MRRALPLVALVSALVACRGDGEGTLNVISFPRGELVVDGRPTGVFTPAPAHRVRGGRRRVGLRAEGVRFEPQTVDVVPGRTTHLYFRARGPDANVPSDEVCRRGRADHCLARIEESARAGRLDVARRLARIALAAHEGDDGYAIILRPLIVRLGGDAGPEPTPDE